MPRRVYLDHNANTLVDKEVIQAVLGELQEIGNPSSIHFHGRNARQRIERARETIANYFNVKPNELIFTSGGTEGANTLLLGLPKSKHIISSNVEHSCVYETLKRMQKLGSEVTFLPADSWGAVRADDVKAAIRPDTGFITMMGANNETGVITDIDGISKLAFQAGIPFIVDGVALLGKANFSISEGITGAFFSAHKVHGPKGVGVIFARQATKFHPYLVGGGQELNRRSGTENLPGIIGFAKAIELLKNNQNQFMSHMQSMRDRLENGLKNALEGVIINGEGPRICNTTNISFLGVDGESLLMALDLEGISVSHGSACSSGAIEPSRILLNMGIPLTQARTAIRFSVCRETTVEEIDYSLEVIIRVIKRLRNFCA